MRYFDWQTRRSLKKADRIITVSNMNFRDLSELEPRSSARITVIPEGPGIEVISDNTLIEKDGILVNGSPFPHKATRETLLLLDAWCKRTGVNKVVTVVGVNGWLDDWGRKPEHISPLYTGRVSNEKMSDFYKEHEVLVMLSEAEGFGLPALDSYLHGTPVCYRDASSLSEVMEGVPGGWKGDSTEEFFIALEAVMSLKQNAIDEIRQRLDRKYNWKQAAQQTMTVYNEMLNN